MTVIAQDDHLTAGAWAACDDGRKFYELESLACFKTKRWKIWGELVCFKGENLWRGKTSINRLMYGWENTGILISNIYVKYKARFIFPIVKTRLLALRCKNYFLKIVLVLFVKVSHFLVITALPTQASFPDVNIGKFHQVAARFLKTLVTYVR